MQNLNDSNENESEKRFVDQRTDDRIREHLINKDDSISADDINNVQSNVSNPSEESSTGDDEKIIDNTKDDQYIGKDDDDRDKPEDITPWNVID